MNPRLLLPRMRHLAGENKLFTGALAVGALLRLLAMLGYPGALWFAGDSYVYIGAALRPQPNLSKATGYSFFLRLLLPFHSFTLVTGVQHLMGLLIAVMIYVLLRRNGVSKTWSAVATLPQLLDGYIIEDEHLIMAETLFTFLFMVVTLLLLWRPRPAWWTAVVAGLLVGAAAVVRTEGEVMLAVIPLYLLLRGWSWKTLRGWAMAVVFAVASLIPVGAYASWFHERNGHYDMTLSTGYYTLGPGLVVRQLRDHQADRPAGAGLPDPADRRSHSARRLHLARPVRAQEHQRQPIGGPVSYQGNQLLTSFAIHAVEAQPLDYVKTVVKGVGLSFGFPGSLTPGPARPTTTASTCTSSVRRRTRASPSRCSRRRTTPGSRRLRPADSAYNDWLNYGHQAPGVVHKIFAAPIALYQRVVFTYGPLLAVIFLVGLGGVISVTARGGGARAPVPSCRCRRCVRCGCTGRRAAPRCCPGSPPSPCWSLRSRSPTSTTAT